MTLSIVSNNGSGDSDRSPFDAIRGYRADGTEYWTARELMKWLGYTSWTSGEKAINRAISSIINQGYDVTQHVMQIQKLSKQNNNKVSEIPDYQLSRFSCYLVAMNADSRKEMVAMAQGYFAIQTRKQELVGHVEFSKNPIGKICDNTSEFKERERQAKESHYTKPTSNRECPEFIFESQLEAFLQVNEIYVERQVRARGKILDLWIPNQLIIECKSGKVSGNDACQAIEYLVSFNLDILLVGTGLTGAASRAVESVNKLSRKYKILFVTKESCFGYLKGVCK